MKIGIVGASEEKWTGTQKAQVKVKIKRILSFAENDVLVDSEETVIGSKVINISKSVDVILVSGGCPKGGVDIWAEEVADELGFKKEIYKPEVNQWNDELRNWETWAKGYRSRNIQVANASDILYVISPKCDKCVDGMEIGFVDKDGIKHPRIEYDMVEGSNWNIMCKKCKGTNSVWNGGEWTGNYAEKIGKRVVRVTI